MHGFTEEEREFRNLCLHAEWPRQHLTISCYAYNKYLLSQSTVFWAYDKVNGHFYYIMSPGNRDLSPMVKYQKYCFLDIGV